MKRSIARKWAAALDSGEYKQGFGQLRTRNGGACCLGVLCNLHAQEHPEVASQQKKKLEYMGAKTLPPDEVVEWSGLCQADGGTENGFEIEGIFYAELTALNDKAKLTFPEIAKIIRKHWKVL